VSDITPANEQLQQLASAYDREVQAYKTICLQQQDDVKAVRNRIQINTSAVQNYMNTRELKSQRIHLSINDKTQTFYLRRKTRRSTRLKKQAIVSMIQRALRAHKHSGVDWKTCLLSAYEQLEYATEEVFTLDKSAAHGKNQHNNNE
jgi:hypothetical protein